MSSVNSVKNSNKCFPADSYRSLMATEKTKTHECNVRGCRVGAVLMAVMHVEDKFSISYFPGESEYFSQLLLIQPCYIYIACQPKY